MMPCLCQLHTFVFYSLDYCLCNKPVYSLKTLKCKVRCDVKVIIITPLLRLGRDEMLLSQII